MTFLLDTDTCVFWLRGQAAVHARLAAVDPEVLNISVITLAELRYGADCSAHPDANHQAIDLLSAATASANGLTLVTNNTAHFGRVAGLTLDNWAQT